ncbi:hypothetical protein MW887_005246 [Aspergillus wentii]|nr:hypothetical protein MW887_005246 [Aspergillus wentii]
MMVQPIQPPTFPRANNFPFRDDSACPGRRVLYSTPLRSPHSGLQSTQRRQVRELYPAWSQSPGDKRHSRPLSVQNSRDRPCLAEDTATMPAVHGDLTTPVAANDEELPFTISPRQVVLRDRVTVATLVPFSPMDEVPRSLLKYLSDQLNKEIEKGDTAIMVMGDVKDVHDIQAMDKNGTDWAKICLGSFTVRPNYPGRSSHVCNGMFLVTDAARNRGVGRLMGEGYLDWAPRLGYTYAVFNLIYETNVASCRIWDSLGFKRIGKVPGGGRLTSGEYVDAIIYGRDLNTEGDDSITQDRFDKIRYYLKHSKYPRGADRAEKSRLRSAATHYKLIGGENGKPEKLMLKDKEVVSDPQQQYDIARDIHVQQHAGINKTTAAIAVQYHWVRIKETVSRVIRDCPQCKETLKQPTTNEFRGEDGSEVEDDMKPGLRESGTGLSPNGTIGTNQLMNDNPIDPSPNHNPFISPHPPAVPGAVESMSDYTAIPLDPQIIDIHQHLPRFQHPDTMTDPYAHGSHNLPSSNFDDEVRQHASHDYQMMMDDTSDGETGAALRQEALRLVNSQAHEVQQQQEILSKYEYSERPDDLDFS